MTQETELQLEAQAEIHADARYDHRDPDERIQWHERYEDFKAGAQTILDAPGEFGLVGREWKEDAIHNADTGVEIAAERDRYRELLEKLLKEDMCSYAGDRLIKEALKQ